jgi:hypothetical protein
MRKRSSKKSDDPNVIAFAGMQSLLEKLDPESVTPEPTKPEKNPAAVALGKLGGVKGGKARAAKLSAKKRKEIAKKAAKARWSKT